MISNATAKFGLIKTMVDAHTMGIHAAAALLRDSGYKVVISNERICYAVERITSDDAKRAILEWIDSNEITHIGFSYRLDPNTGVDIFGRLVYMLTSEGYYGGDKSKIKKVFFAGLPAACELVNREYGGSIATFRGGESPEESLIVMGVPIEDIPKSIKEGCQYDKDLYKFGEQVIRSGNYMNIQAHIRNDYPEFGTNKDTLELRLKNNCYDGSQPIIRAHSGPYYEGVDRLDMIKEYITWCHKLAREGLLDVLSIGSSQLSQSCFGEDWTGKINGGGVPINSEIELKEIWDSARPMLVRTYSGSSNIMKLAEIYERCINIAWHALSLWWFNELDGRGPNSLYNNLKEHIDTIRYISTTNKPVETNVPHHFAFRGADDVTYILSGLLAAKTAKKYGTKTFVLQNMLNTPRSTWGIQDLAKGRTLLKMVKELEDDGFRVILQTRAGLDYFKPDLETAKIQLASVTALMDDIDPLNEMSPEIIHVVSYSEALFLATPEIINESIRITKASLDDYRRLKKRGLTPNVTNEEVLKRQHYLETACRRIIKAMEDSIPDLYSPEGLYIAFVAGWLPVPELWSDSEEFINAKAWSSKIMNGGVVLCDQDIIISTESRINRCVNNLASAEYTLKHKYKSEKII